jgi:hypothetical protein
VKMNEIYIWWKWWVAHWIFWLADFKDKAMSSQIVACFELFRTWSTLVSWWVFHIYVSNC